MCASGGQLCDEERKEPKVRKRSKRESELYENSQTQSGASGSTIVSRMEVLRPDPLAAKPEATQIAFDFEPRTRFSAGE